MPDLFTSLPRQIYCYADRAFMSQGQRQGFERCAWFGLTSVPNRAWGLSVLLECGALYQMLPPNAIAFRPDPPPWTLEQAQRWDCYSDRLAVHEYTMLAERDVDCYVRGEWLRGRYLTTAQNYGDGYSAEPEQAKQYHFVALNNGRLTALPGNCCLFHDPAFTKVNGKPDWLRTQTKVYACESREPWDATITESSA